MITSIDVAQRIYDQLGWVDSWRLEKLTYYAQAWSLGWYGRPLFDEDFQAWPDGPVEPHLFSVNKYLRDGWTSAFLPNADVSKIGSFELQVIDSVLEYYRDFTKDQLIEMTHKEEPWKFARQGFGPNEQSSKVISKRSMKVYYALKELNGDGVPVRPAISAPRSEPRSDYNNLRANAERWKSALDILALR
ncbi:MAG: DUF4065 domain-containing protein [Corynebacterium sp.]|nr:DUF4065 domain-containing protein [Corynebacterium sp.]